jgi:hypothetical protein
MFLTNVVFIVIVLSASFSSFFWFWPSLISRPEKSFLAVRRCTAGNPARGYAERLRNPPLPLRRGGASDAAPSPTGFTEIVCDYFRVIHLMSSSGSFPENSAVKLYRPFLLQLGREQQFFHVHGFFSAANS